MGFVEETGVAQHYRDARIAPIYEGTNGIQARDLVGRKVLRDRGKTAKAYISELLEVADRTARFDAPADAVGKTLASAVHALLQATDWLIENGSKSPARAFAGATNYLELFGIVAGGALMARSWERCRCDSSESSTQMIEPTDCTWPPTAG